MSEVEKPLSAALRYSRLGFSVMPLRDGKGDDLKKPAYKWDQYQEVAADEELINLWWEENPNRGVAIITGTVSRLVVLDFDGPKSAALMEQQGYPLTPTATVQTGKGMHLYYRTSEAIPNRVALFSDGQGSQVDVRGEGGYVVAPPSRHGSGRQYIWTRGLDEIKLLPPLLEQLLTEPAHDNKIASLDNDWYTKVEVGVEQGSRNETAAKVCGYWLRVCHGNAEPALRAALLWNRQNKPPLNDAEMSAVMNSVYKRDQLARKAESQRELPPQKVYSGSEWARDLETAEPRRGEQIEMPGLEFIDGLVPGDLVVLAGRPGMGKSTFATQVCTHAALQRLVPTWIVSAEMTRQQWGRWMAISYLGIEAKDTPRPLPKSVLDAFRCAPITITDDGAVNIDELKALSKGHQGIRLIVVDHLSLIAGGKRRKESRVLEVGEVVSGLKATAKELGCTVLALCQMGRDIEKRENRRPRLSDLYESSYVEQFADAVFFLYSPQEIRKNEPTRRITLALEKFRHGPVRDVQLEFQTTRRRFVEVQSD